MEITKKQILAIMPNAKSVVDKYLGYLNEYCPKYGINTARRMRYFLAQIAHESMELRSPVELSSGKQYDTGRKAWQYSSGRRRRTAIQGPWADPAHRDD